MVQHEAVASRVMSRVKAQQWSGDLSHPRRALVLCSHYTAQQSMIATVASARALLALVYVASATVVAP